MGLFAPNAQAAQGMSLIAFVFAFISSAYVPATSMPGWLQPFSKYQPITPMVDAVRALLAGSSSDVGLALAWSAMLAGRLHAHRGAALPAGLTRRDHRAALAPALLVTMGRCQDEAARRRRAPERLAASASAEKGSLRCRRLRSSDSAGSAGQR